LNCCISGGVIGAEVGVTYSCSSALGAILLPRAQTARVNLNDTTHLRQYIKQNIDAWYEFALSQGVGEEQAPEGSITLVYGCDKSASWAVAAFTERSSDGSVFFNGGMIAGASPASPQLRGSWSHLRRVGAEFRDGPAPEIASRPVDTAAAVSGVSGIFPSNCRDPIFVRAFRIKRKMVGLKWPLRIRAGAGPRNLDGGDFPEDPEAPTAIAVSNDDAEGSLSRMRGEFRFRAMSEQVWATLFIHYMHSTLLQIISRSIDYAMDADDSGAEGDSNNSSVDISLDYHMVRP
jgi:hypothetical protein